jgi:hypothetical protein
MHNGEPNLAAIARTILDHHVPGESEKDYSDFMVRVAGNLNFEQFKALHEILDHEHAQIIAKHEHELAQIEATREILSGVPAGTPFYEACCIRAAQGHKLAQQALVSMNSREYRVEMALFEAAAAAHPGWRRLAEDGHYEKDKDAPEDNELIEWFQKTHSHEARAIEDAIE